MEFQKISKIFYNLKCRETVKSSQYGENENTQELQLC